MWRYPESSSPSAGCLRVAHPRAASAPTQNQTDQRPFAPPAPLPQLPAAADSSATVPNPHESTKVVVSRAAAPPPPDADGRTSLPLIAEPSDTQIVASAFADALTCVYDAASGVVLGLELAGRTACSVDGSRVTIPLTAGYISGVALAPAAASPQVFFSSFFFGGRALRARARALRRRRCASLAHHPHSHPQIGKLVFDVRTDPGCVKGWGACGWRRGSVGTAERDCVGGRRREMA
jgi:hypothetical protein